MLKDKFRTRRGMLKYAREIENTALDSYGIQADRIKLMGVSDNITYRVETKPGRWYLLRLHQNEQTSKGEIISELVWLEYLKTTDLVAPVGVKNTDNSYVTEIRTKFAEKSQLCSLMEWVDGRLINEDTQSARISNIGALMAKLHNYSAEFQPDNSFTRPVWGAKSLLADLDKLGGNYHQFMSKEDYRVFQRAVEKVCVEIAELETNSRDFGMIHADLHMGNVLLHKGELRMIDFGRCGYGHYMYDVAQSFLGIIPVQRKSFLEEYQTQRQLPDNHKSELGTFYIMACIENICFHSSDPLEIEDLTKKTPFFLTLLDMYLSEKPFIFGRE